MDFTIHAIYKHMLQQKHLLVAGATGSGKSVLVNGLIYTALCDSPKNKQFVFIDPKRVELYRYKRVKHCLLYSSEPVEMVNALKDAMRTIDCRYREMQKKGLLQYNGSHIYIVIDELADLMSIAKKEVVPLIQRICQIGRAANVHVIACTQCPLSEILPTKIKVNFDSRVGLRTASKQDSRNILDVTGCECLPKYGKCIYKCPDFTGIESVPYVQPDEIEKAIAHRKKAWYQL